MVILFLIFLMLWIFGAHLVISDMFVLVAFSFFQLFLMKELLYFHLFRPIS